MKKRIFIFIIILVLFVPISDKLKDGGTTEYRAITYKVTKYHKIDNNYKSGYMTGVNVKIFGIEVYNKIDEVDKDNSIDEKVVFYEITTDGVNEEELIKNIDQGILTEIASEFQQLTDEITKKQIDDPESVLRGDWISDIVNNKRYKMVIEMGNKAMKPLYFIIYKSKNSGMYEYICSLALEKISGYNFDSDNDGIKWSNSKEFLEEFNIIINNE